MSVELLKQTLGNDEWMKNNRDKIKKILPETWTHAANYNLLAFGFQLKLLGVMWTDVKELPQILKLLHKVGILQGDGFLIRANPNG